MSSPSSTPPAGPTRTSAKNAEHAGRPTRWLPPRDSSYHSTPPHVLGPQRQLHRLVNTSSKENDKSSKKKFDLTASRRRLPQHTQAPAGPTRTSAKHAEQAGGPAPRRHLPQHHAPCPGPSTSTLPPGQLHRPAAASAPAHPSSRRPHKNLRQKRGVGRRACHTIRSCALDVDFTASRRRLPQHTQAAAGPTRTSAKHAEQAGGPAPRRHLPQHPAPCPGGSTSTLPPGQLHRLAAATAPAHPSSRRPHKNLRQKRGAGRRACHTIRSCALDVDHTALRRRLPRHTRPTAPPASSHVPSTSSRHHHPRRTRLRPASSYAAAADQTRGVLLVRPLRRRR